ncbi:class I SAM-dependent methyltransferase [Phytoactinopolyspora mesophila]|uniref:Methyltransferase domain-containing protein n=1 Tax=Phytoactinopolyspora mesophila TaxID=2650750 RepID=A0A7K3M6S3_9ACTN|nr:class I SAM-dependent methyltransferase [Phytoactinopolyspora mesophila]NDL58955.1 methyltransferase domain-containing protein [Phytoactinopolyspora mesophila]
MPRAHVRHPVFARIYAKASRSMEREVGEHRSRLLTGLSGRIVEVGAGNGMNFTHYPPEVTSVVAVEPEPYLRRLAWEEALRAAVPVKVVDGIAEQLPLDDAEFDAGVASLVLCSVRHPAIAMAELFRVIRPGGQLRFYEHVRATSPRLSRVQRAMDATVWPSISGGCHAHRDTGTAIAEAGFIIEQMDSLRVPDTRLSPPTSPHIIGVATRPR